MDINAAIEHMRSRNEPMYGAWEVCKAAGIDPKRQARLFAHPAIMTFLGERGLIYTTVLVKSGRKLAAVAAASMFSEDEAKARRAVQAEAARRSTERARESRRHYKSNHSKAPIKAREQETEEVSIPPLDECKRIVVALDRTAKRERACLACMKRTGNLPRQDDVAVEDRSIMRRILDPVSGSAWHIGNQDLRSIHNSVEQGDEDRYDAGGWLITTEDTPEKVLAHCEKHPGGRYAYLVNEGWKVEELSRPSTSELLTPLQVRRIRLAVLQADRKNVDDHWEREGRAQHEEEQRQAQWHRRKMANITARARQDKVAAEAAYSVGLVARVELPDPNQLDLLELFAA